MASTASTQVGAQYGVNTHEAKITQQIQNIHILQHALLVSAGSGHSETCCWSARDCWKQ